MRDPRLDSAVGRPSRDRSAPALRTNRRPALALWALLGLALLCALAPPSNGVALQAGDPPVDPSDPTPYVIPERLMIPELPESPTLVEQGEYAYYFHCMPCHGDAGQGLTDEWRAVWEADHQYCWGRGCHAGRPGEAFMIPRTIPAVAGVPYALAGFATAQDLEAYLRETHPPQRPGALEDQEYHALTAYLMDATGRPFAEAATGTPELRMALLTLGLASGLLLAMRLAVRRPT